MLKLRLFIAFAFLSLWIVAAKENGWDELREPSPALSAAEEMKTFQLEPNMTVELVAEEPMVQEPVALSFDEDGR
ncbi:MAG: hypothetical protein RI995_1494, partial [Bacteroidota bacterium]